jgi:predicted hydrocarbon binding protein/KaiC/GvpD/RAD55 family RecA-like ATPase
MASVAKIQEPPDKSLVLLFGTPGAGKSTFCHQAVIRTIANDSPVIFVASEQSPNEVVETLREMGIGESVGLSFVDAFSETVGLANTQRSDTINANCADLNSLSIAITRQKDRVGKEGVFLAFDSLTSPYLFSGAEIVKFMRLFLLKFAAEGNSVLALIDEGCGKEEDLVAMQSVADGILRMEVKERSRFINVVKHPEVEPVVIEMPPPGIQDKKIWDLGAREQDFVEEIPAMMRGRETQGITRRHLGNYVNFFWVNFAFWSSVVWDPEGSMEMTYEVNKKHGASMRETFPLLPWYMKLLLKFVIPRSCSSVKDMKKLLKMGRIWERYRCGTLQYLEDISKTDEHHLRVYENFECYGLKDIGTAVASFLPGLAAGLCKGCEKIEREWNAVETKCIGLGDPYCEFKLVPREIDGLRNSLKKDASIVDRIHERLIEQLIGFLINNKPLLERPRLGSDLDIDMVVSVMSVPAMSGERRYRMAWRMGGVKSGRKVGEGLLEAGLSADECIKRIIDFMNYCKVGEVTMDYKTISIEENCESLWTKPYTVKWEEPQCFFTTGFLNGLFSAAKDQHVREVKCIATGDPYCEWEIV